jgi:ubiquinone/menaquinone biosynthesis C-methylase UbiE
MADAPIYPIDGRSFAAAQSFLLGAKVFWTRRIFPEVRAEYERRVAQAGTRPASASQAGALLAPSTLYQYYAWLERHLQRFKYSGRYGLQAWHAQQRAALVSALDAAETGGAGSLLELDAKLPLPRYYTSCDIHQHPGGVWGDPIAGLVYERGARTTTPLAGQRHKDLHDRLTDMALELCPAPSRVLDMACGFGKSTRPFYERCPDASIEAIDLAAPCLRVAAREAARAGASHVRFRQMSATATDYPDRSFDLVTSTMLLHEMPPPVIEETLREARRVLKPGGRMVHLDFLPQVQPGADAFSQFMHYGHGRRNNEPFMEPLAEMDLRETLARLGFHDVEIRPFEEAEGTLAAGYASWRFPWCVVIARA